MELVSILNRCIGNGEPLDLDFKSIIGNVFGSQRPLFSLTEKVWNPPADVYETSEGMVIRMEIAGVRQDQIEITVENNYLMVRGCRRENTVLPKENFHLMEIRYGRFERVFGMPSKLQADKISAQYNNGFLVIAIPKAPPVSRQIVVEMEEN